MKAKKYCVCVKYKVRERQLECEEVCEPVYVRETDKIRPSVYVGVFQGKVYT